MSRGSGLPIAELLLVFVLIEVIRMVAALADLVGGLFVLSPPVSENPWTIVTSVYAHAGFGHLTSNAIALVLFGWPVARATTRLRFHTFFLLTGVIAGLSQILLSDLMTTLPLLDASATSGVLGASGAVFALLGYLLASNRLSSGLGSIVTLPRWATYAVFFVVAAALTLATAQPGVALIAHFTGLLVGLVAGRLNLLSLSSSRNEPPL